MSNTQKTSATRGAFGCVFGGCGTICLIVAMLLGLIGLKKLGQSQRTTSSVQITAGDSTHILTEPIEASLAQLSFPLSSNEAILVDPHDPNKAAIHSTPGNGVQIADSVMHSVIIVDNISLERSTSTDKWHLSSDEVASIASQFAPKEAISQNGGRSQIAFIGAGILLVAGIVIILIAKSFRS